MIEPMLAFDAKGNWNMVPTDGTWVMEPKFDGIRFQLAVVGLGVVKATGGRNGSDHSGRHPHLENEMFKLPVDTVLDGELVSIGGQTCFVAFDCLRYDGTPLINHSWLNRRYWLERAVTRIDSPLVVLPPAVEVSETVYDEWREQGIEGAVCKDKSAHYRPGRRSRYWLKFKGVETTDAIVIGWKHGVGKNNTGRCGALLVTLVESGKETTVGFDVTPEKADAMVGRRIELIHSGWQKSGKVRHPRFGRTREDLEVVR